LDIINSVDQIIDEVMYINGTTVSFLKLIFINVFLPTYTIGAVDIFSDELFKISDLTTGGH